jgi:hypothetical protein
LYDGTIEYEQKYLQTYIDHPDSVIVLAFDDEGNVIVGASTAIPMRDETTELQKPFLEHGYDINKVFYCNRKSRQMSYPIV